MGRGFGEGCGHGLEIWPMASYWVTLSMGSMGTATSIARKHCPKRHHAHQVAGHHALPHAFNNLCNLFEGHGVYMGQITCIIGGTAQGRNQEELTQC